MKTDLPAVLKDLIGQLSLMLVVIGYLVSLALIGQPVVLLFVSMAVIGYHLERLALIGSHCHVILHQTAVTQGVTDWQEVM